MIAACDLKYAPGVGEFALLHVLDPGTIHAQRAPGSRVLQATVQAWQPMHLRLSMMNPYLIAEIFQRKRHLRVPY